MGLKPRHPRPRARCETPAGNVGVQHITALLDSLKSFHTKKIKTFKFPKGSNSTALPDSGSQTLRFHGPGKLGKLFSSQLNGDQLFILPS